MSIRLSSFTLLAITLPVGMSAAGLEVSFADPDSFYDFGLHEDQSVEDAVIIMERELQSFWDRRMSRELPEGWGLSIEFTEIDLAGEMNPLKHPNFKPIRSYEDRLPPRMEFNYVIYNANGEEVESGEDNVIGKNYLFAGSGRILREEFAFGYEMETLREWLQRKGAAYRK